MRREAARATGLGLLFLLLLAAGRAATAAGGENSEPVHFTSADGKTARVGYLFVPGGPGRHPAVVLLPRAERP